MGGTPGEGQERPEEGQDTGQRGERQWGLVDRWEGPPRRGGLPGVSKAASGRVRSALHQHRGCHAFGDLPRSGQGREVRLTEGLELSMVFG